MFLFDFCDVPIVEINNLERDRPPRQHEHPRKDRVELHPVEEMERSEADNMVVFASTL